MCGPEALEKIYILLFWGLLGGLLKNPLGHEIVPTLECCLGIPFFHVSGVVEGGLVV